MIAEKAYAKINLTLSVGEKREDGYHEIDSVMHSISLCDEVTLTEAGGISLSIKEGLAPGGKANLMWEAAELFFRETGFSGGVHMELVKQIPSEAGMGGGSSDAAAVLRGLNRMTGQQLSFLRIQIITLVRVLGENDSVIHACFYHFRDLRNDCCTLYIAQRSGRKIVLHVNDN